MHEALYLLAPDELFVHDRRRFRVLTSTQRHVNGLDGVGETRH